MANQARSAAGLVAGILVTLVAGCASPAPGPSTTVEAAPTPTPTVPSVSVPEPRLDIACAQIATPASASALLTAPVTVRDPAATALGAFPAIPIPYYARTAGAVVCEWSNGIAVSDASGGASGYIGARVSILPEASAQWTLLQDAYGFAGDRRLNCFEIDLSVNCYLDSLVNGSWIDARLSSMNVPASAGVAGWEAAAAPFFDAVTAAVTATPALSAGWSPPPGTLPLPSNCDGFLTPAQVQSALGLAEAPVFEGPHGGWSQGASAITEASDFGCHFAAASSDSGYGTLNWIPGGDWAAAEARPHAPAPWVTADVDLTGLGEGDSAYIRCLPGDETCYVDVSLGHNWIQVGVWRVEEGAPGVTVNRRIAAVGIAQAVVDTLL